MQACGAHVGALTYCCHPCSYSSSRKNQTCSIARVLDAIFDLLARSSVSKTILVDWSSVCDSFDGPISFCSSGYLFAHLANVGDHVLELACQIYMVQTSFGARYGL